MATQKDLLRTAILSGAAEGMSTSGELVTVSTPSSLPSGGFSTVSPIRGYCGVRVLATRGSKDGGSPWLAIKTEAVEENINASWFTGGGVFTTIPVSKGQNVYITGAEIKMDVLRFIKVIGGGHKRYLPSLSRSRFGGALWLRLKTTSETLQRGLHGSCLRRQAVSLSPLLGAEANELLRLATVGSVCGEETPQTIPFATVACGTMKHFQTSNRGLQTSRRHWFPSSSLFGKVRRSTAHGMSFLFSGSQRGFSFGAWAASNNARMEVAA